MIETICAALSIILIHVYLIAVYRRIKRLEAACIVLGQGFLWLSGEHRKALDLLHNHISKDLERAMNDDELFVSRH